MLARKKADVVCRQPAVLQQRAEFGNIARSTSYHRGARQAAQEVVEVDRLTRIPQRGHRADGPTQGRGAAPEFADKDRKRRAIAQIIVRDPTVEKENALVVRRDWRLDVVMTSSVTGQSGP